MKDRANAVVQWLMAAEKDPSMIQGAWLLMLESDYVWRKPLQVCSEGAGQKKVVRRVVPKGAAAGVRRAGAVRRPAALRHACTTRCAGRRRSRPPPSALLQAPGDAFGPAVMGLGFEYDYINPAYPTVAPAIKEMCPTCIPEKV